MKRAFLLSFITAVFFFLILSSGLQAQDPGNPDTVRIGTASGNPQAKFAVPVYLYNDEALQAVNIPLVIKDFSGQVRYDSVTFGTGRLSDPSILDARTVNRFGYQFPLTDSLLIRLAVSTGNALPAGDGKLCDIWVTALFGGQVTIDSIFSIDSTTGHVLMLTAPLDVYISPQFVPGNITVACNYVIGDVRNLGSVNLSSYLGFWKAFYGCTESPNYAASDVNCDRLIDMRDQVALRKFIYGLGSLCTCGSYNPPSYDDPGLPDTLWIKNDTMVVGIEDSILVGLINDEPLAGAAFGLEWNGSARLASHTCLSACVLPRFTYLGLLKYGCPNADGTNPDTAYYSTPTTANSSSEMIVPGRDAIYKIDVTPLAAGEITFRLVPFPNFGSGSMLVSETGAAILPAVVGQVTVVSAFCGDANHDAKVNIGDAVYLINYVFKSGPAPNPACSGNANGDASVNVADAVYLINYVFKGGPAPIAGCCP